MQIFETIGFNVRKRRMSCKYAQEDFANEIGVSPYYYGKIERGTANPTVKILSNIADGLGVTIADLITEENNEGE